MESPSCGHRLASSNKKTIQAFSHLQVALNGRKKKRRGLLRRLEERGLSGKKGVRKYCEYVELENERQDRVVNIKHVSISWSSYAGLQGDAQLSDWIEVC
jgi:hypothetical protein